MKTRMVLVALIVIGLSTVYGVSQRFAAQSPQISVTKSHTSSDDIVVAFVGPDDDTDEWSGMTTDALSSVAQVTAVPPDGVSSVSVTLPDALEGLDSTEYRMTRMLCQDVY